MARWQRRPPWCPLRAAEARRGGARLTSRAGASRTRPTIERHVPLAAGRPLRPTNSHFFIFPPNVATAVTSTFSHKSLSGPRYREVNARRGGGRDAAHRRSLKPKWQDEGSPVREPACDRAVLFADGMCLVI